MIDPAKRTRHLELLAITRLDLWRIRGEVAAKLNAPRQAPRIPSKDEAAIAERRAAWLAGYDAIRRTA